ncbi:MAG: ribosome hibernation-promoting factor, HPF/YfiA family [Mycetocola sp.]
METNIVGRGLGITDRFRDYVEEKTAKVDILAPTAQVLEIKISRHADKSGKRGSDRAEITLVGKGPLVRAEAEASDKYAAFDLAHAKLSERLRRAKERRTDLRGKHRLSLHEVAADNFTDVDIVPADSDVLDRVATGSIDVVDATETEESYSPIVIREKLFDAEWMTAEDAVDRMELVGHDFFLFIDARSDRPSVVYRRKGWDYGVIALDNAEVAPQSAAS